MTRSQNPGAASLPWAVDGPSPSWVPWAAAVGAEAHVEDARGAEDWWYRMSRVVEAGET